MLIYLDGKLYRDDEVPAILVLTPQDRLDIYGMNPSDNLLITFPDGMTEEERKEFVEGYMKLVHDNAKDEIEKQGKQSQLTLPGF